MRIRRLLAALVLSLLLCSAFAIAVSAHDVPDMSREGSISGTMLYDGETVGGGTLTVYRVGDISGDDGNYSFTLSDEFAGSDLSLENISDSGAAADLAEYAENNSLSGITLNIGADGSWMADGLEPGLYLLMQNDPAEGFEAIAPFLVSVPIYEDGTYVYNVSAGPKMSTLTETPDIETPSEPVDTPDTRLPQTGQMNWPVPVLAVLGMALLLTGWGLHSGKQRKYYEA